MKTTKILYMLWVNDMDRAVAFYHGVVGLERARPIAQLVGTDARRLDRRPPSGFQRHLPHDRPQLRGRRHRRGLPRNRSLPAASIVHPPRDGGIPGLRLAEITDPDGNRIQLGSHAN